jgi:hypothetical protein
MSKEYAARRSTTTNTGRSFLSIAIVGLVLAAMGASAIAAGEPPIRSELSGAPEIRLPARTVTLPIVMVREYPFIEGEIAGVKGKLMLDTGMQRRFEINDHRVPLTGGTKTATGYFGSGETFDIREHAAVEGVRIGNLRFPKVTKVESQDARMLERITPDFIGWIGQGAFADHAMKLDYRRLKVTFYSGTSKEYLKGEKVMAALPFQTRKIPNIPLLPVRIGDVEAIASLDTGMYGALSIPDAKRKRLVADGMLKATADPDEYDLSGVRIAKRVNGSFPKIEVAEGPSPSAKSVGIIEDTELELGYVFLRRYKTVWDYRQKRIYLLAP